MGRKILTVFAAFVLVMAILESDLLARAIIYIIITGVLWIPPRYVYKVRFLRELDQGLINYNWFKRLTVFMFGRKQYDEMASILRERE